MRKKFICLTVIFLLLFSTLETYASAQEKIIEKEEFYIVFAVDHSGSMNSLDEQNMIAGTINAFVDTMQSETVKIGYVAYNDTIVDEYPLVSVLSQEQRTELKEIIGSAGNRGETDIGLGLNEAYRMLEDYSGRKMIVLISDGETDLENSNTGRTREDSDRDVQEVITKCRKENIAIAAIALGQEYGENSQELHNISGQTNGKNYLIQEPLNLFSCLCDLFYNGPGYSVYEAGSSIYDQGSQKIRYENAGVSDELTILLLSDKEIGNADILRSAQEQEETASNEDEIIFENAGNYAVARLYGSKENLNISFDTQQKQKVAVYIIEKQNIVPALEWSDELYKNKTLRFRIFFEDRDGNPVDNLVNYENCLWSAEFENLQTGELIEAEIREDADGLSGTVSFDRSGDYILRLGIGEDTQSFYEISGINILNTLPGSVSAKEIELLTITGQHEENLDEYFADPDGDALGYELLEVPEDVVKAEIQENHLLLEPEGRGSGEIKLLVSDGEGKLIGTIPVRTKSVPEACWQVVLGLICIIVFGIIKLWGRKKSRMPLPEKLEDKNECSFTGKLNAYFTLLPQNMDEIPPLAFALHPVREKKIILGNMFSDYPELIDLLMLDNIYLFPAENRKMILYHDCDSAIMIGNSIVCRKMQYIVSYGNVIYITSKDGTCELEVHYISMI